MTLPTADARDTVSRAFYDKDGQFVGSLDGEGYLIQIVYDKAGQKVRQTAFAAATSAALRAAGSFANLLGSVVASAATDRNVYYSYDGQGQLRYVIDGFGYVSQTDYDRAGQATGVIQYAAALAATADYTYDNV